jgi:hypothetical protein
MLSYEDLVEGLEHAWNTAGLHEHTVAETVQPDTHERLYRAELFPEHPDPLTEENMPPWVELTFSWTAAHQLYIEGRDIDPDPLDLAWNYMVLVRGPLREVGDVELVRIFQRAIYSGLRRFYPNMADDPGTVAVEVRRVYHAGNNQRPRLAYIQLVSTNLTDLSEQWHTLDPLSLRQLLRNELQLVSAIVRALAEGFYPDGNGNYRAVDTA